tara:strand:- start:117 stop:485 length:369 start_codon:yes stop_codon:yes gene_type:complete
MIIKAACRGMEVKRAGNAADIGMCWTCGHWAKVTDKKCNCCHQTVRERNDHEVLNIKQNLDECLAGMKDPEYRFYSKTWVFWARSDLLKEYEALKGEDKYEKYYNFILKAFNDGRLTRVARM